MKQTITILVIFGTLMGCQDTNKENIEKNFGNQKSDSLTKRSFSQNDLEDLYLLKSISLNEWQKIYIPKLTTDKIKPKLISLNSKNIEIDTLSKAIMEADIQDADILRLKKRLQKENNDFNISTSPYREMWQALNKLAK